MLSIKVSGNVGAEIVDVMREMMLLSVQLQVITVQDINGIHVIVFPHTVPEELYERYKVAADKGRKVVS